MGFTYFIQQADECCFKIGSSESNVEGRLTNLQVGNPKRLRIFGVIQSDDYEKLENDLQNRFAKYKENGEWYSIDPVTTVKTLNEFSGKICVDDPYKFSLNNGKIELDVERMVNVIETRVLHSANEEFKKMLSTLTSEIKITSEMAKAVAIRKASRRKAFAAFSLAFFPVFVVFSAILFYFCFDAGKNGWLFHSDQIISFVAWELVLFVASALFGVMVGHDNKAVTDADIKWHEFNRIRKEYLKKGLS